MTDPRIDKLNELAKQVYAIAETLNAEGTNCASCGSFRRDDWHEWALRHKVEGAVVTLSNLASAFERLPSQKQRAKP